MRILVHDYAGHPFQLQLSRGLAARGHRVLHCYCGATLTPRGELTRRRDDPDTFKVQCVDLPVMISKYKFVQRFKLESEYGRRLVRVCDNFQPEVILSANTPSLAQYQLARWCDRRAIRFVSWIQDMYGAAEHRILSKRLPILGNLAGRYLMWLDKQSARLSDQIVVITEDFEPVFRQWGVNPDRLHTIHNWATLDALDVVPRDNEWSRALELTDEFRFIYAGTLTRQHNPNLLLQLGRQLDARGQGQLIVVSEGDGIAWLRMQADKHRVQRLRFLGFQPFDRLAEVLGSADVLVAMLEPEAGVFCVPSKVLSYFCAGRPVLAAIPESNLAARLVKNHFLGIVVSPLAEKDFLAAAAQLQDHPEAGRQYGRNARLYAEEHFDFDRICQRFLSILEGRTEEHSLGGQSSSSRSLASTE